MKPLLLIVAASLAMPVSASMLNNHARLAINRQNQEMKMRTFAENQNISRNDETDDEEDQIPYYPMLVSISDEAAVNHLLEIGSIIYHRRDNILLVSIPSEHVDRLSPEYGVCRAEMSPTISVAMNKARQAMFVDAVHAGTPSANMPGLDGSGVISGFTDTGFDARHPAFQGRVAMLTDYDACNGVHKGAYAPAEIADWVTDNTDERHASHVCGIMAGGYRGNDVYGVAPGATIAAATSRLSDVGILAGIEDIIAFAKEKDMPAVINMSLSSNLGPHDGSDLFCQYLDKCADDAVIVMSAGNSGSMSKPAHYFHTFKGSPENQEQLFIAYGSYLYRGNYKMRGNIDVWGLDNKPFSVRLAVLDDSQPAYVHFTEAVTVDPSKPTQLVITPENDPEWGRYFSGYMALAAEVNEANGRSNVTVSIHHNSTAESLNGAWARYYNVLVIEADPGVQTHVFADFGNVFLRRFPNVPTPDTDFSISSIACGYNTLCVGASNNRSSITALDGTVYDYGVAPGEIGEYTSNAVLDDGRRLPHFAAPGTVVISCGSTPYAEAHPDDYEPHTHSVVSDGIEYHWIQNSGTSMASPHVAGIVALLLEADPSLTAAEVRDILRETADNNVPDASNLRWGAGLVNAYEAVKRVFANSSVTSVDVSQKLLVDIVGKNITVTAPAAFNGQSVRLYTTSGALAGSSRIDNCTTSLTAPAPGFYILQLNHITQKIVVK